MVSSLSLRNLHVLYLGWTFIFTSVKKGIVPVLQGILVSFFNTCDFFFGGLFVKMTSFPLLRNFDVFFTCEYIFTGHFPTCHYIVDSFTCEEDIISVLEEFWCFFTCDFFVYLWKRHHPRPWGICESLHCLDPQSWFPSNIIPTCCQKSLVSVKKI